MIKVNNLIKSFGKQKNIILHDLSFEVNDGEFISLTGKSGSGKTTLLYAISSLDKPSSGQILIDNQDVYTLSNTSLNKFRNQKIGFVFQFHYLLPELSALENVMMPANKNPDNKNGKEYAEHLLEKFNIAEHMHKKPGQLSGGQRQRVAIARAMINKPEYLFADEPTGSLDSANSEIIMNLFDDLNKELKTTIVFVTHDPDFAASAGRQIILKDGKII